MYSANRGVRRVVWDDRTKVWDEQSDIATGSVVSQDTARLTWQNIYNLADILEERAMRTSRLLQQA